MSLKTRRTYFILISIFYCLVYPMKIRTMVRLGRGPQAGSVTARSEKGFFMTAFFIVADDGYSLKIKHQPYITCLMKGEDRDQDIHEIFKDRMRHDPPSLYDGVDGWICSSGQQCEQRFDKLGIF